MCGLLQALLGLRDERVFIVSSVLLAALILLQLN